MELVRLNSIYWTCVGGQVSLRVVRLFQQLQIANVIANQYVIATTVEIAVKSVAFG